MITPSVNFRPYTTYKRKLMSRQSNVVRAGSRVCASAQPRKQRSDLVESVSTHVARLVERARERAPRDKFTGTIADTLIVHAQACDSGCALPNCRLAGEVVYTAYALALSDGASITPSTHAAFERVQKSDHGGMLSESLASFEQALKFRLRAFHRAIFSALTLSAGVAPSASTREELARCSAVLVRNARAQALAGLGAAKNDEGVKGGGANERANTKTVKNDNGAGVVASVDRAWPRTQNDSDSESVAAHDVWDTLRRSLRTTSAPSGSDPK